MHLRFKKQQAGGHFLVEVCGLVGSAPAPLLHLRAVGLACVGVCMDTGRQDRSNANAKFGCNSSELYIYHGQTT